MRIGVKFFSRIEKISEIFLFAIFLRKFFIRIARIIRPFFLMFCIFFLHILKIRNIFFDNYWHDNGRSTREHKAQFSDFSPENLYKASTINHWIFRNCLLIQHSHRLDNFFMNFHHFMRMYKAARINENMPRNRPHPHIFLNRKSHNARLSEIFSIRKHVSSYRSNRFFINIKCVKTKFHRAFFKIFIRKSKNLTDSKFFLPDFKVF